MKMRFLGIVLSVLMLLACGFNALGEEAASLPENNVSSAEIDPLLEARLLNMLSHNRAFGSDFADETEIIGSSITALCDRADEDGFLRAELVAGFVYNMYGIDLESYTPDERFPKKDGFIFVVPTGLDIYSHEIISVEDDDRYLTVLSDMEVQSHDGYTYRYTCRSIFKRTDESAFGYNLLSCNFY